MTKLSPDTVLEALRGVNDPELDRSLVDLDMIHDVSVDADGRVSFRLVLTTPACPLKSKIQSDCRAAVMALDGVTEVEIRMDAVVQGVRTEPGDPIPGVRQLILIMSGKGGVGKSTVAMNIALALAGEGAAVGLLDADIQGPSLPTLLGSHEPAYASPHGRILPATAHGVKFLSMGQFLESDHQAVIWRGPMLSTLLRQFLLEVEWGEIDYLVADLPPGTGDAALTLSQTVTVTGAVIVTTPQEVALLDVKKAVDMCQEVGLPILGVVENMSFFECPECGVRHELFGSGGGEAIAAASSAPLLGKIPLDPMVRADGDAGEPTVLGDDDRSRAESFKSVARALAAHISRHSLGRTAGGPLPPREGPTPCGSC